MSGVELHSIRDVWYHNLSKFPRKTALVDGAHTWTYSDCDVLSDRLRSALCARFGLHAGQVVAIAGPNCAEYFLAYWTVIKSGGIVAPINTRLGAEEMRHVFQALQAQVLFVHSSCWRSVEPALEGSSVRHIISIGAIDGVSAAFDELVEETGPLADRPDIRADDVAIVMHTSGTTGRPKGAVLRHADLLFNNRLAIYAHGLCHDDVHLLVVPMFHATALYSLVPTAALTGATIVVAHRADVGYMLDLVEEHRVTTFFGVPMMFRLLVGVPGVRHRDLNSLRLIAYAGSPMAPDTIHRLRELFPHVRLHNFFGLTETISMTHVLPDSDAATRPESIGKLLPHVCQAILDADGKQVAAGETGELHLHRSNVISGYWNEPERLARSIRGKWFATGDLAMADKDGYVYLKGRTKDMIIVGGENVYALEVENCLMTHPAVLDAAVVGVSATGVRVALGELVKAFVVVRAGENISAIDLRRHCSEHLATYKVPHMVEFREDLPRNAGGKVVKRLLREE